MIKIFALFIFLHISHIQAEEWLPASQIDNQKNLFAQKNKRPQTKAQAKTEAETSQYISTPTDKNDEALQNETNRQEYKNKDLTFHSQTSDNFQNLAENNEPARNLIDEDSSSFPSLDFQKIEGLSAFWKTDFITKFLSDQHETCFIGMPGFYGKLNWELLDAVSFHTQTVFIGPRGFCQSVFERDDRRGWHFLDYFIQGDISPRLSLKLGIIKQDFLSAPLLMTDKSLYSLVARYSLNLPSDNELFLLFQTAIANSLGLFTEDYHKTRIPSFITASTVFQTKRLLNSSIKNIFTLWHYNNLSPAIAKNSQRLGNHLDKSRLGQDDADSIFQYKFFGLHNHLKLKKNLSDLWILEMGGEFLHNFSPPPTYNKGARIYSSIYHNYKNIMELKGSMAFFANQSDSSVAYYSSEIYGRNNRKGFLTKAESHFFNSGLTLGASFVYSRPINPNKPPFTGPALSLSVFLKTDYIAI